MKIKYKLLVTFGLLIGLAFAIVGINLMTYQTMASDANFVNYSGKLRATSYKMAQLANVVSITNDQASAKSLNESIALFDTIMIDLTKGNIEKGLSELKHKESIDRLNDISTQWQTKYKKAYQMVLDSSDAEALLLVNNEVAEYVNTINTFVTEYSNYSSNKVATAKIINLVLGVLAFIIGLVAYVILNTGIRKPIGTLIEDLKKLSQGNGDLTKRIAVTSKDEIGEMTVHFNQFIGNIHDIVCEIAKISKVLSHNMSGISNTTEELTKSTELIAGSSMDVAEGSAVQNSKLDQLNHLVDRIKLDINTVTQKANQTLDSSKESQNSVEKGDRQVTNQANELNAFVLSIRSASNTVEDLNQSSEEIKAIVDLIHNVSSQTNLLALNASIEAARAGEAGRGFAVVADEIRKLAEETSRSAQRISLIVSTISDKTVNVKHSMDELVDKTKIQEKEMDILKEELKDILRLTAVTLEETKGIMNISSKVDNDFIEIIHSAKEIQAVAVQNSGNSQDVASAVEEQTASFEEVSANIGSISEMADELTNIVGRFKI